ncbi:MAG: helix-hairpin-helix domain-containing protein [Micropruina sp.]|nr:helix-hairpin-helix domain-containing protein [Micropruina sp.]
MVTRRISDDALGDVVRRRLEVLLAEIPARRLIPAGVAGVEGDPSADSPPASREESAADRVAPRRQHRAGRVEQGHAPTARHEVDDDVRDPPPGQAPGRVQALTEAGVGVLGQAWAFARGHAVVLGIIVLTGCFWAGYSLLQAKTTPVAVAVTQPSQAPVGPGASVALTPSAAPPSAPPGVVVHVLGAVRKPGVVKLPDGSRVADALMAAGGLTKSARPGELNLAAILADGSQIVVGSTGDPGGEVRGGGSSSGEGASGSSPLNLNTATVSQLDTLPGVGPVTAQKILDWRTEHGRFSRVEELQEVAGIGPKSYAELAPHVRV